MGSGDLLGTLGLCKGLPINLGGEQEGVPPSLLPPSKSNGPASGEISHCPSCFFLCLIPAWAPHPGQLPHKWESGWRPGQAGTCVLRQPVPVLASSSLCTGPLPPVWKAPAASSFQLLLPLRSRPRGA